MYLGKLEKPAKMLFLLLFPREFESNNCVEFCVFNVYLRRALFQLFQFFNISALTNEICKGQRPYPKYSQITGPLSFWEIHPPF